MNAYNALMKMLGLVIEPDDDSAASKAGEAFRRATSGPAFSMPSSPRAPAPASQEETIAALQAALAPAPKQRHGHYQHKAGSPTMEKAAGGVGLGGNACTGFTRM